MIAIPIKTLYGKPRGLLRATLSLAASMLAFAPALAQSPQGLGMGQGGSLFLTSLFGGVAIAAAVTALALKRQMLALGRQLYRSRSQIEALSEREVNFKALAALEPQIAIVWSKDKARLLLHTLPAAVAAPSKLVHLLRFSCWLNGDDAVEIEGYLAHLRATGEPFSLKVTTATNHSLEVTGAACAADVVLRFRPLSPIHQELAPLMAENRRLKRMLSDRDGLLDALPIPIWIRDNAGALIWVNAEYAKAVNARGRDDVVRRQVELFEARQLSEFAQHLQSRKPGRLRLQTVIDGKVQKYEAVGAQLSAGTAGAAFDIAPLATAEHELEQQMEAHARTLDKVATGVAIFGADRKLVYGNAALAEIWRLENHWLEQKPTAGDLFDLLRQRRQLPDHSHYRRWRDERLLAFDGKNTLDEFWHLPDGRAVHVITDYRSDGGLTFLFDDVTDMLTLQRQFQNLIDVQRETLDHLAEGLAVFGSNGRLQLYNPAFGAIWKLEADALQGAPHVEGLIALCQRLAPANSLWTSVRQAVTGIAEARDTVTGVIECADGRHLAYALTPLPDGGTLLTFVDITDSKRIEVVLMERNEALEAADRLKSAFLSHVSYELRTPLTSIIGFTDLLADADFGPLAEKQREYLGHIKSSSQVLLTVINDILDLAVIDAGALDLRLSPIPVRGIIEEAELGVRERLSKSKVTLDVHVADDVTTVMADKNRLTQMLFNLLSNAIGFSPEGSTITLACRRETGGVTFSVQDTGLGIPEEEQASVFDRFASRTKGSRHRGAGLGLSLVKSLVELHNGRIDLRSTPGAGTTVTIFLPDHHTALQ